MSFTIEALLGIRPKVENEETPEQIGMNKSCSEDEENIEEDIESEGERLVSQTNLHTLTICRLLDRIKGEKTTRTSMLERKPCLDSSLYTIPLNKRFCNYLGILQGILAFQKIGA